MRGFVIDGMGDAQTDTEHEWHELLRDLIGIHAEEDQESLLYQLVDDIKNQTSHESIMKLSERRRKKNLYDFVDEYEEERGLRHTIAGQCRKRIDVFLFSVNDTAIDTTINPRE